MNRATAVHEDRDTQKLRLDIFGYTIAFTAADLITSHSQAHNTINCAAHTTGTGAFPLQQRTKLV